MWSLERGKLGRGRTVPGRRESTRNCSQHAETANCALLDASPLEKGGLDNDAQAPTILTPSAAIVLPDALISFPITSPISGLTLQHFLVPESKSTRIERDGLLQSDWKLWN